ncbi:MAG: F510_1955 family glycosylhydrolase [Egibacteraceae bacterium]
MQLIGGRSLIGLAVAVLLVACGTGNQAAPQQEPGVVHVHALAVDPTDERGLYVATHTGLFHMDAAGKAQRVGEHYHDLMGFTVAGPGDFIASGHPDLQTDQLRASGKPPLLGLVHSTDGGANWQPLSLLGEVDFHSLQAAHDLVYGYDSTGQTFMVSNDRTTWEKRSSLALADFAVSPDDPDLVVASTSNGLVRSSDGGRTWQPAADAQPAILDWNSSGLYRVVGDGAVAISTDAGATWQSRGSIGGSPEALLARDDLLLAAAADRGIVESRDGGQTWELRVKTGGSGDQ